MSETELIFLGTGTSSSLPHVDCLTSPPDGKRCRTCLSTLTPEGKKNIRRNTSAVVRTKAKDGRLVTIVIDAGKTFQAAAVEWFPMYGLRKIDALLITHAHADAMNGLDDLRGWTLGKAIQDHIDVYLSQTTFVEVQRSFPYLVSKEFASGGGDVPEFKWHIIEDKVPFEILDTGVMVTPFAVHHGRVFSAAPLPGYIPTPGSTKPSTPATTRPSSPIAKLRQLSLSQSLASIDKDKPAEKKETIQPYLCFGFKIEEKILYISDVSFIPEDIWPLLTSLPVLVLDCLHIKAHSSHLNVEDSIATARKIGADRTYLTGFSHRIGHDEGVTITEAVGGKRVEDEGQLTEVEREGLSLIGDGEPAWIRPAHDGLRVVIRDEGVSDETY